MQTKPWCWVCMLDDMHGAMELCGMEEGEMQKVMNSCVGLIARTSEEGHTPAWYITRMHRILKSALNSTMLFTGLRENCNRIGKEVVEEIRVETADYPLGKKLHTYLLYAMAGNHLDFRTVGTGYGIGSDNIRALVEETAAQGFTVDQRDRIVSLIAKADSILYIPDNVGEIAFDALLVQTISETGKKVTVPYRGGAITSDAVKADLDDVGMCDHARCICAGPDTLGVSMDEMSSELLYSLNSTDIVITKGQANFYFVHEYGTEFNVPRIASVLTTKCSYVSRIFGYKDDSIRAAAVVKDEGEMKI